MAYTEVAISGYNTNPPPDDGSTLAANSVSWAKIKTKLFDPIRDGLQTIDDNIASAITTADADLATLEAAIDVLDAQVDAIASAMRGPTGTAMLFRQTTPPTGWTKGTDLDDYALRLVTGTPSTGGSTAFTSVFTSRTILTANLPSHTHSFSDTGTLSFVDSTGFLINVSEDDTATGATGGSDRVTSVSDDTATVSGTFSFSVTSGSTGSGSAWDFAVQYVDTIYATKA